MRTFVGGWRTGNGGNGEVFSPRGGCRAGEKGRKNSYGDSLSLVECETDAKFGQNLTKHRRIPRSPAESFHPFSPFRLFVGRTEDREGSGPSCILHKLIVSFIKWGGVWSKPLLGYRVLGDWEGGGKKEGRKFNVVSIMDIRMGS